MAISTVQIQNRIVGGNPDLPAIAPIALEFGRTTITLADLIRRTVEEQVWNLVNRQRMEAEEARRVLARHYYTDEEIARDAESGAVRFPTGRESRGSVDPETEVEKAVTAFLDGAFIVLVNGSQVASLDETLTLGESTNVSFVRLTPLVGG